MLITHIHTGRYVSHARQRSDIHMARRFGRAPLCEMPTAAVLTREYRDVVFEDVGCLTNHNNNNINNNNNYNNTNEIIIIILLLLLLIIIIIHVFTLKTQS